MNPRELTDEANEETFEQIAGEYADRAKSEHQAQIERREKKREKQRYNIEEYVHKFIAGETLKEAAIHKRCSLVTIEDTLYYIGIGDKVKQYIPLCIRNLGGYYVLNSWGFDEVSRANIDEMCIREISKVINSSSTMNYTGRVVRLPMQSNVGSPKIEILYKDLDSQAGYFKAKLGTVKDKLAHIARDPDADYAESKEELEQAAEELEGMVHVILDIAHFQGERDMKVMLEDYVGTAQWLKEIADGEDFYDTEVFSADQEHMQRAIELQQGIKAFLETVDDKVLVLQEIARRQRP